jgi:transposase
MLRLANTGWSIPKIARHFDLTESRARHWVKAFLDGGFAALENKKSPGPKRKLTPEIIAHLKQVVGQDGRTWTAPRCWSGCKNSTDWS